MPSPEHLPQYAPDHSKGAPKKESEQPPYRQAARFLGGQAEAQSGQVYFQAQEAIYEDEQCDLSAYRLQLRRIWHVAVLGEHPTTETEQKIEAILSAGEAVALPTEVIDFLNERRMQATKMGNWVEWHYRPGKD